MDYQLSLPLELAPYREKFLSTVQPFIKIIPQEAGPTKPWQSKIGGEPYLPKDMDFPRGTEKEALFFLAQFNFSELPPLPGFPETGILQFFINDDSLWGLNTEAPTVQANFRVVYFPEITEDLTLLHTDFSKLNWDYDGLPIEPGISYPLKFELRQEAVPLSDYRFIENLGEDFFEKFGEGQWDIIDAYTKMVNPSGHKIGGYAYFTQQDPRYDHGPMELLFQLDNDPAINCRWGDMGVGNFFIKKEDLERRDFSGVLFHWDCF